MDRGQTAVRSTFAGSRSARCRHLGDRGRASPVHTCSECRDLQRERRWSHTVHTPTTATGLLKEQQRRTPPRALQGATLCAPPNHLDSFRRAHLVPQGRSSQAPPGCRPRRVAALERPDPLGRPDRGAVRRGAGAAGGDGHGALGARASCSPTSTSRAASSCRAVCCSTSCATCRRSRSRWPRARARAC